jgi:hypothetical protein
MNLIVLTGKYSIYRFENDHVLPDWIYSSDFYSITKTHDEVSVITTQSELISGNYTSSKDWRILKVIGPLDFNLVGIIADIAVILKDNKIPIFTISTYETDYIMVREKDLESGITALREKEYLVSIEG